MNRLAVGVANKEESFPRVSGDEPNLIETQEVRGPFSPRERG